MEKTQMRNFVIFFTACLMMPVVPAFADDATEVMQTAQENNGLEGTEPLSMSHGAETKAKVKAEEPVVPATESALNDAAAPVVPPAESEKDIEEEALLQADSAPQAGAIEAEPETPKPAQPAVAPVTPQAPAASVPASKPAEPLETEAVAKPAAEEKPAEKAPAPPNPFPSGLLEIAGYKYPVFLYAPQGYRPDMSYPMVLVAPSEGAKAEEGIKYLKGLADRKNVFILSPHGLWPVGGDTPYELDKWILDIKRDVMERFPIDKDKVFIAGRGNGANYAAYLAMKHPREFAGAALLNGGWAGSFSQLMEVRSKPDGQVPFFVAFCADKSEIKQKNQPWLDKLQAKGYPLKLVEVKSAEGLSELEFKKTMFDWLDTTSQSWASTVARSHKGWKAKFKKGVKDFFAV